MSWIQKLYETYNNCQSNIGYAEDDRQRPLLPVCHVTVQANIEVVIDGEGNFIRARVITDRNDATTIIPSTEESASKSGSKPINHPLCDRLQYLAGDFTEYGGVVTSGFSKNPLEPYKNYIELLTDWCQSEYSHPKVEAVLRYVQKKALVKDLVNHQILFVGNDQKLLEKGKAQREKNATDIFSVVDSQDNSVVRWVVESPGILESRTWKDKSLWESWINYYLLSKEEESLCYVTGKSAILTSNHPKYIRKKGDGAKLISSNDTSGFTFRGRFITDQQACNVSLEVSQKAHYALAWLISRQGYTRDTQAIVAWATSGKKIPQPTDNTTDLFDLGQLPGENSALAYTAQDFALRLNTRIRGYNVELGPSDDIQIIALDSATTGRLSITYYRELKNADYLERLEKWHSGCSWLHDFGYNPDTKKYYRFIGAPTPRDIAEAAYGKRIDKKLRNTTVERLLPCIVDGRPVPRDLVESVVRRACNRIGIKESDDKYERGWNKTLSIACALYKKYREKEKYEMALDPNRKTRDYLYGRLLALAESLEEWALSEANEDRATNAARLMQRFSERPYSTWRTIELALLPYKIRLGAKSKKRQQMIDEVIALFKPEDFIKDKRLSGEFLLGYHCQREFLHPVKTKESENDLENIEL